MKKYSIPQPCREEWSRMTEREKGRYCEVCEKCVVDFTKMPLVDISTYLDKKKDENTCGRLTANQLELLNQKPGYGSWFKRYVALAAGITLFNLPKTFSQEINQSRDSIEYVKEKGSNKVCESTNKSGEVAISPLAEIKIKGSIIDENGDPIIGATVRIAGTNLGALSDIEGFFSLELPEKEDMSQDSLVVSYVGSEPLTVALADIKEDQVLELKASSVLLGDVVIVGGVRRASLPRRIWWGIKNIFRKKK